MRDWPVDRSSSISERRRVSSTPSARRSFTVVAVSSARSPEYTWPRRVAAARTMNRARRSCWGRGCRTGARRARGRRCRRGPARRGVPCPWCWWQVWQFLAKTAWPRSGVAGQLERGLIAVEHGRALRRRELRQHGRGARLARRDRPGAGGPRGSRHRARAGAMTWRSIARISGSASAGEPARAESSSRRVASASDSQRSSALSASEARPTRATARAAATWTSRGWSAASRPGMIPSARSGRPRASTSRATRRSGTGPARSGRCRCDRPQRRQPFERCLQVGRRRRRPGRAAAGRLAPGRRPGPRAGSSRPFVSPRLRSAIVPSKVASSGAMVAGPDDRGALREQVGAALRGRDPIAQGDEGQSRLGQSAEDRQPHPGVGRIPGGDPTEGLQGGRLLPAAIAQGQRGLEPDPDRGVVGQADECLAWRATDRARLDRRTRSACSRRPGCGSPASWPTTRRRIDEADPVQRPQGMEPRQGIRRLLQHRTEQGFDSTASWLQVDPLGHASLDQQPLRRHAPPGVAIAEHRDERPIVGPAAGSAGGSRPRPRTSAGSARSARGRASGGSRPSPAPIRARTGDARPARGTCRRRRAPRRDRSPG